ncbi:negative transcriptional regulator, PaiB family [Methylophilus rhizosphaerae]|uniref:Negative transcriptional regulator, PaiB family n=1 Tax=Methylophilus rhizosphaerae TaxID=492660 RepID=A0A1G8ZP57_9PROT|nr:FMN-binding negative transcriptional regulator [Methylophilus rhizosphaerae]SDK16848.1 negative transcriptional regulator, PaiB family [Methylophilus rhizosphaerae]
MYIPKHFAEPDKTALYDIVRAYPLATLVTQTADGVDANHVPLHLTVQNGTAITLSGHVARANPLWKTYNGSKEVLAIFHGPNAYITPSWYPEKARSGMVVPTWNYVVVHVHGNLKVIDDASWLRRHLALLTAQQEASFKKPWQVEDAPSNFIEKMIQAVVGIEINITSLTGKWKSSQNQPVENQLGAVQGLQESDATVNHQMASIMTAVNRLG